MKNLVKGKIASEDDIRDNSCCLDILYRNGVSQIMVDTEDDGILYSERAIYHLENDTRTTEWITVHFKDMDGVLHRLTKNCEPTHSLDEEWYIEEDVIDIDVLQMEYAKILVDNYNDYVLKDKMYRNMIQMADGFLSTNN